MLVASPAAAYEVDRDGKASWPFKEITYYVGQIAGSNPDASPRIVPAEPGRARAVARAMLAWTRADVGWRLRRVNTRAPAKADLLIELNPRSAFRRCQGLATKGFAFTQALIGIRGRCGRGQLLSLVAAHELGHVLGLGDESRQCAVMNQGYVRVAGRLRPAQCTRNSAEQGGLVWTDDRRGAQVLNRRRFSLPKGLCDPLDESPVGAADAFCRYTFDCRGVDGDHLVDGDGDGITDNVETEDQIIHQCRRMLRVSPLPLEGFDARSPRAPDGSRGQYSGLTSQGEPISFKVRGRYLRGLRLGVGYQCSDGTRRFARSDPLRLRDDGEEDLGPFPAIELSRRGLRQAFETPSQTALYELEGSYANGTWNGSFRAIEGWDAVNERVQNGQLFADFVPNPDGLFLCDTGTIAFTAPRRGG
jgi:hypothetical protein